MMDSMAGTLIATLITFDVP